MVYAELTVIVDGAVEEEETFFDEPFLNQRLAEIKDEARDHGYPTDVYVQYHEHELTEEECGCAQYATDHHPLASYNQEPAVDEEGAASDEAAGVS